MNLFGKKALKSRYDIDVGKPENQVGVDINNAASSFTSSNFIDWYTMGMQTAGVLVSEQTAMQVGAVYACVSLIGGIIASMPINILETTLEGSVKVQPDLWYSLNREPHPDYSAATFWRAMMAAKLLHGNGYAKLIRPTIYSSKVIGFQWIHPRRVSVTRDNGQLIYTVQNDMYSQNAGNDASESFTSADFIHIPGPGFNGLIGLSQIRYALRTSAAIALAADQYSADFFQNGAKPDFALIAPAKPTPEQQNQMRESWATQHQGMGKQHLPALLYGGWDIKELTMSAEDTQLMATRAFQVAEIARIFGVPPHMIGQTESNTSWGTGVEQMSLGFRRYTLTPHLNEFEQEFTRKAFGKKSPYTIKFDPTDLEKGDYGTRMTAYRAALGRAGEQSFMTQNEVRAKENLPPLEGGDTLFHEIEPTDATVKTPSDY